MSAVVLRARAELRASWASWTAVALVIGLAGATVLAAAAGARRTDTAYPRLLRASRAADLLVAPFSSPDDPGEPAFYAELGRLPGVTAMGMGTGIGTVDARTGKEVLLEAGADGALGRSLERPKVTAGRMFDPRRLDEAVAEAPLARRLHLSPGSRLHLLVGPGTPEGFRFDLAKPVDVRVVGVGVTREDVVAVNAQAAQPALMVTPALLEAVSAQFASREAYVAYEGAFVRLAPATSPSLVGRLAQEAASRHLAPGSELLIADLRQQAAAVQRAIHPQAVALALFALLVAVAGVVITGQLIWRQLLLASVDHPALRALGMTGGQLVAMRLVQVLLTAAAGALAAMLIAAASSPLAPIGPARVAEPHPGVAVNWAVLGVGGVAVVALLVLAMAVPAWRLESPARLAPLGGTGRRPSRLVEALTTWGAPPTASVGTRLALEPGRGRTAVPVRSAVAGTALAVAAAAAAVTFGSNLARLVGTPRLYGQDWDGAVDAQFGSLPPDQLVRFLGQHPEVAAWTLGNHHVATVGGHETPAIGMIAGRGRVMFPTIVEGRAPLAPDEVVLGSHTLGAAHTGVGRSVAVAVQGEDAPRRMRVVGRAVFPFFGQGTFSPTGLGEGAAFLDPPPGPDGVNLLLVRLAGGGDKEARLAALARDVRAACPADQDCGLVTAQRPVDVRNYASIRSTPLVLAAVLALLAVATVAHAIVTAVRRRRRDLAVLKTLGFVRPQVSAVVAWQATVLVVVALVVGLPVGIAGGRWAWQAFAARLGAATDARVPLAAVGAMVGGSLLVANGVAAVPGWVAGRLRPAAVLRTE